MNEHERFAEELIERGLQRAGEVEPLGGLEERLLGKLEAGKQRSVRWWWMAAPVAAAVLIVALIYWRPQPAKPLAQAEKPPVKLEAQAPISPAAQTSAGQGTRKARNPMAMRRVEQLAAAQPSPRLDVFPAPAPLSAEEKFLVALAQRQPGTASEIARDQAKPVKELAIAAIRVEPLAPEVQTNGIE